MIRYMHRASTIFEWYTRCGCRICMLALLGCRICMCRKNWKKPWLVFGGMLGGHLGRCLGVPYRNLSCRFPEHFRKFASTGKIQKIENDFCPDVCFCCWAYLIYTKGSILVIFCFRNVDLQMLVFLRFDLENFGLESSGRPVGKMST